MRRLLTTVLVLLVLAVIVDYGARIAAQNVVAQRVRTSTGMQATPTVRIAGFPFLTQVAAGTYDRVTVTGAGLPAGEGLQVDQVNGTFSGMHLPLRDALGGGGTGTIPVDQVRVGGTAGYATLEAAIGPRLPKGVVALRLGYGGPGQIQVRATYQNGVSAEISATARVALAGSALTFAVPAQSIKGVPAALAEQVAGLLGTTLGLERLPLGLKPSAISVTQSGVTVTATGERVQLPAGG